MKTTRTIGLGLGLTLLACVGAVTFSRGQQAGEKAGTRATRRAELRHRIITLRTEVDILRPRVRRPAGPPT